MNVSSIAAATSSLLPQTWNSGIAPVWTVPSQSTPTLPVYKGSHAAILYGIDATIIKSFDQLVGTNLSAVA